MSLAPLDERDQRLRETCAFLSRRDLHLAAQQAEIDELLDFVYGKTNKRVRGVARDRARPSTVGLSANQVGIMKQICIVDLSIGRRGYFDLQVLVNPRIVWSSKTSVHKSEGCVNFTTIWGKTRRSQRVRVEAWDRSGHAITLDVDGWAAALLQHEVDHLNGRLFIDRLIDPKQADLVQEGEYVDYRKDRGIWPVKVDVSARIVADDS